MSKRALVLCGGGMVGYAYEIGALTAINDFFYEDSFSVNKFDTYVGTSAGAILASLCANNVPPRLIYKGVITGQGSPFNFEREDIYGLNIREGFGMFWKLLKDIFPLLAYFIRNPRQFSAVGIMKLLQEVMPSGIYSLSRFENFLQRSFEEHHLSNDFKQLGAELFIPAMELDSAERWIFGQGDLMDTPIHKAVMASVAMPLFYRPTRIDGRDFVDGVFYSTTHIDIAVEAGAKLIFVINPTIPVKHNSVRQTIPTLSGNVRYLAEKGMFQVWHQSRRALARFCLEQEIENARLKHPDVDIILLQPGEHEMDVLLHGPMNFSKRVQIMNRGYNSTLNYLQNNQEQLLPMMQAHGLKASLKHTHANRFQRFLRAIRWRR